MSLGLHESRLFEQKEKRVKTKKRKIEDEDNDETERVAKVQRVAVEPGDGVRRSARNAGKNINYDSEIRQSLPEPLIARTRKSENDGPMGRDGGKRTHNPYEPFFLEPANVLGELTLMIAKHLDIFLALKLVLGGSQGRVAVQMRSTRKMLLISKMGQLLTRYSVDHGSLASLVVVKVHIVLPLVVATRTTLILATDCTYCHLLSFGLV